MQNYTKTRTKVVHKIKNVSQGCFEVRRSKSKNIKITFNCVFISIHTNFHQNRSIDECTRIILAEKLSFMTLDDL